MPPLHSAPAQRKRSGQWFVAATPNWPLDDLTILREVDGEMGLELLLALYNVRLVAETPIPIRAQLFEVTNSRALEISIPTEIRDALYTLFRLPRETQAPSDRELARACRVIAEWAEDRSCFVTAVGFAEVAARLVPDDPELANRAGRACRRAGERARAELWYERGFGLARRRGDVLQYVKGHLGYGSIFRDQGDYGNALRWIKRAGISARKAGHREAGAEAMHDAFALAYLQEDFGRAASLIRRAARIYPVHARRVPYFAADVALLLSRRGLYAMAMELLRVCANPSHRTGRLLTGMGSGCVCIRRRRRSRSLRCGTPSHTPDGGSVPRVQRGRAGLRRSRSAPAQRLGVSRDPDRGIHGPSER